MRTVRKEYLNNIKKLQASLFRTLWRARHTMLWLCIQFSVCISGIMPRNGGHFQRVRWNIHFVLANKTERGFGLCMELYFYSSDFFSNLFKFCTATMRSFWSNRTSKVTYLERKCREKFAHLINMSVIQYWVLKNYVGLASTVSDFIWIAWQCFQQQKRPQKILKMKPKYFPAKELET